MTSPQTAFANPVTNAPPSHESGNEGPRRRRRLAVGVGAVLVAAAGIAVAVGNPFAGDAHKASSGVSDNAYPAAATTVAREALSSETEVQGTLGYATPGNVTTANVVLPTGTAPSTLSQDEDQVTTAEENLASDQATLQATEQANAQALSQAEQAAEGQLLSSSR